MKSILASLSLAALAVVATLPSTLNAKTLYVDAASGSDANDGLTEQTPFLTLQAAVDAADTDDVIVAAPGVYDQGGRADAYGNDPLENRVCIEKRVTLRSSHGPEQTLIVGRRGSSDSGLASDAMRCIRALVYNTVIEGFTLTNGHTTAEEWTFSSKGGGAYLDYGTIVSNCVFTGNAAHSGGASYQGRLLACTVRGNTALEEGGGTFYGNHENCLIVGNHASRGGGSSCASLSHCTVVGNRATLQGGGTVWGDLLNSIIYYNEAPNTPNWSGYWNMAHSCTYPAPEYTQFVIAADPKFVNTNGWSDLRLTQASLCIDTGSPNHTTTATDFDGNPRSAGNAPDMGAFEWQGTGDPIVGFDDETTQAVEDAGTLDITLFLSAPADGDTTFNLVYSGTAVSGTDYTGAPASVTFSDGQTTATVSLTLTDDTTPEYPETVVIDLQTIAGYRYAFTRHTVTILDNDGMPEITRFHLNSGKGGISTRLIEDFDLEVVNDPTDYVLSEDPDFTGVQWITHSEEDPFTFTLSEGYGEKTVWFKVRKPDGAGGYLVSLPVSDTIWYGPTLAEAIDQPDATVDTWGDNGAAWFSVASPDAVGGFVARSSSPMPGDDWAYSSLATTLSVAQPMILSFTIESFDNINCEFYLNDEYVYLENSWASGPHTYTFELEPGEHTLRWEGNAWPGHGGGAAGYCTLDDVRLDPLPPRVWFSTETQRAREGEAPQTSVLLEWPLATPLTVNYTLGGTATPGSDFTTSPQSAVTIPAGETNAVLTVSIIDDTEPENGETALISLAPGSGYRIATPAVHTIHILANDGRIDLLGFWLEGGDTETTNLVVRVDGDASDEPSHVLLSENPDFTGSEWVEVSDNILFTLSEGYGAKTVYAKVRIPKTGGGWEESNVLSASITRVELTLKNALDTHLTVSTPTNAPWFGQSIITHDGEDAAQSAVLPYADQYASSYMTVTVEGPAKIAFWWKISSNTYYSYYYWGTLRFFVNDSSVSAINGEQDWIYVTHTVPEGTHTLKWQYDQNYYHGGSNCGWVDQLRVTPDWPEATFSSASQSVAESAGQILIPVQLDRQESAPVTVNYTLGGTATQGADYTCTPQDSITFAPGETTKNITVSITDDDEPERGETVILTLTPAEGVLIGTPGQHVLTILHNDGAPVITAFGLEGGGSAAVSRDVSLAVTADGDPTEYRLSEDPAFADAAWLPYTGTPTFQLSEGFGTKTLWLEIRKPFQSGHVLSDPASLTLTLRPSLDEALNLIPGATVTTSGNANWFGQTAVSRDGAAAQSGPIGAYGASSCTLTLNGHGTVGFWWKVSSENGWDYLRLIADNSQVNAIAGEVNWTYVTHTFSAPGTHTIEWRYTKDGSVDSGSDCGWVDQVDLSGWNFGQVATPAFSPEDGTTFDTTLDIAISCATTGAQIRYTLDGSDPTEESPLYTGPVTLTGTTTVKAKGFLANAPASETAVALFVRSTAMPLFDPPSGTLFINTLDVAITSAVPTVAIHYTLDGSDPTDGSALYTAPITLATNATIKARAYNGTTPASGITSATYTLQPAASPTFAPSGGLLFDTSCDVTLSCATADAAIRYTLDGSDPTGESDLYVAPITCTAPMTLIRARAFKAGMAPSAASSASYLRRGGAHGWGYNGYGQLNVPSHATNIVALASGTHHVIALLNDGTLAAWGNNGNGECNVPSTLSDPVAIAAGAYHSLALRADGSVAAWGYNGNGQCNVPAALADAIAVAAGNSHSLALKSDGSVAAWGYNDYGQCTPPANLSNVVAVAAGTYHSLALKSDGSVAAWGNNWYGQTTVPVTLSDVVAIAAGAYHSLALKSDGSIVAWGYNGNGQCNIQSAASNVFALAAGDYHSLALRADGSVAGSGYNDYGQATPPEGLVCVAGLSGGGNHSFARFDDLAPVSATPPSGYQIPPGSDTALAVSLAAAAQGGTVRYTLDGSEPTDTSAAYAAPLELASAATLKARLFREGQPVGATLTATYAKRAAAPLFTPAPSAQFIPQGGTLAVALSAQEDGAVIRYTLDGSEPTEASETYAAPLQLAGRATLKARTFKDGFIASTVATAYYTQAGDLYGWGANGSGQSDIPAALSNVIAVAAGGSHTLALRPDGSVAAWGYNGSGQRNVPAGLSNAVAIAAGQSYSAALRADGSVAVWGDNSYGQCATPYGLTDAVAITAGGNHLLALRADGSIAAWGYNGNAECDVPQNASNALAVAAGGNHSLALLSDGTVVAWGYNGSGQRNVPAGLSNVVAIAAGWNHSVALRADGTVVAWGWNTEGQCTIPSGLSNVIAIAAGDAHTAALRADGSLVLWGRNTAGQSVLPAQLPTVAAVTAGGSHTFVRFSPVTSLAFTPPAGYWIPPAPASLAVAIASTDQQGGVIRHTLDGSEPTDASAAYAGPLDLTGQTTVRAQLFRDGTPAGAPVSATYFKRLAAPVFAPASGTQFIPQDGTLVVTLSCADPDVAIRYTLDGSEPTETSGIYTAPIDLAQTVIVKARAFKPGFIPSASSTARYARNGDLSAWGQNSNGQGTIPQTLSNTVQIAAGFYNSAALRADGTVAVWGYNGYSMNTPPADLTNAVAVALGTYHGLALRASGTVTAWGNNGNGQCNVPEGLLDVVSIAASAYNSAAVKSDGSVSVWGYSGYNVNTPPADLTNALVLALGPYHALALCADGTVAAWGDTGSGKCTVPSSVSNAVAVAAGESHSVALRADGAVIAWGYNGDGQCDVPAGLSNVIAIAAGNRHTVALRADGSVFAWGYNSQGQALVPAGLPPVASIAAAGEFTLIRYGEPAPVTFVPPAGMMVPGSGYPFPVHVLAATLGGTLRHTLDDTAPSDESDAYTAPAMLGDATTVRAALFRDGQRLGAESSAHYPLLPGGVVFHTVTTAVTPAEAGTASGGGIVRKHAATTVTATVTNTVKYTFGRWLRNGTAVSTLPVYTFTVTANSAMTAVFDLKTFQVTAAVEPQNLGWVSGTGWWSYGVTNTLTAYPYSGCRFLGWEDALTGEPLGSASTYTLAVTDALTVRARFEELVTSHTVTTRTEPEGLATVTGAGVYPNGQLATFTAPHAVTNDPVRHVFQYYKRNGSWATSANPWNWWMSRTDPSDIEVTAVYTAQPLSPKVRLVSSNLGSLVPATDNLQLSVVFDRQMNPAHAPLVTLTNLTAGGAARTLPATNSWTGWYVQTDTYRCPPVGFVRGDDGDYVLSVANARDTYDGILAATNAWSFRVDATPPPLPTLRLTASNDTWFTVGWSDYAPTPDLNGFRVYVSETAFSNLATLSPVAYYWSGARAFTRYGIQLDTTYWVAVVPVDQAGNMETLVTPFAVRIPRAVPPPVTLTVTAPAADTALLNWAGYAGDSFGFAGFHVYQAPAPFDSVTNMTPVATLAKNLRAHTASGLDRTLTHWFAVVGFNSRGEFIPEVTAKPWSDPYQGAITQNTTLGANGTVTEILGTLTVNGGANLTIPAGATLAFRPGTGIVIENGRLTADGTALRPILMTATNLTGAAPQAGDWLGVTLGAQAGASVLRHVRMEYGRGLTVTGCAPVVAACTAFYNSPAAIRAQAGATVRTADALLLYNAAALLAEEGATLDVARSIIRNNQTNALAAAGAAFAATNVWWGSADLPSIQSGHSGTLLCQPFLSAEPVLTPAADAADGNRNVGVQSVTLALAARVADAVQISEDSLFTGSFFDTFEPRKTVALSDGGGSKTLYVRYRNAAGQLSDAVSVPINYITGGPQITGCNIAEGAVLTRPFTLTASAYSGLGVATLRLTVDNVVALETNAAALNTRWDIRNLAPGTHRVRIEAFDTVGNLGTRAFNVTANIQPPPNPVLNAPANNLLTTEASVTVSGTAEPFETVALRRNGSVIQNVTAAANGAFSAAMPLVEGENVLIATVTDAYGTGRSNERRVTRDSGAPEPVTLLAPSYVQGTGLRFVWHLPAEGEAPSSVALLRSATPFATAAEATWQSPWTTDNPLIAAPPSDGRWYFAAFGRDAANNQSLISNLVTNDYDGTAPAFTVAFDKPSPCGTGLLRLEIESSEPLAGLPTVTVQPPAASGPTMLTVSNTAPNRYTCAYNVQSLAGSGPLVVKASGTDFAGNRATGVTPSGDPMILDTRAPAGLLETTPSGLIQVTNPVPMLVTLRLDETPAAAPALSFIPPEGATLAVALTGGGTNWSGQLELLPSMGSGIARFTLAVSDTLGNAGSQLGGATQAELYNTANPVPPARVTDLRASTDQPAGLIKLAWMPSPDAETYALYRQAGVSGTIPDELIAEDIAAAVHEDTPPEDGFYRYAVRAVRRGSAADPSPVATGFSDRTPPPAPQNLTAALSSSGVRVEWEYAAEGEQPVKFRVYRNGVLLRDNLSPATRHISDNPPRGTWSYTAAAADRNGNEAASNESAIDMTLPGVTRTDVTVGADRIPRITWQTRAEHAGVNLYRNGVKLNAAPLTGSSFTDAGLSGSAVTRYEVRGVNAEGTESAARQLPVYHLSFGLAVNPETGGNALQRYFDRCAVTVSNRTTGAAFDLASLTLTRTAAGTPALARTVQAAQSAASGGSTAVDVVLPCATSAGAQAFAATLLQSLDDASASVRYETSFAGGIPALSLAQLDITLDAQPVAGAACLPQARFHNRSEVPIDLVMWRNGLSGDVAVRVLDSHETEVNRVDVMMPKASLVPTPDGTRGFIRIQPKSSTLLQLPEIIVPEALGEEPNAFIEVRANVIYTACGQSGEEISGPLQGRVAITPRPTPYTAFGLPEHGVYRAGETMVITGYAFDRATGDRTPDAPVNVGVALDGYAWFVETVSDAQGNIRAEWPILPGVSGLCQVWASHPQVKDRLNHGQAAIYQAYFRPQEGALRMAANDELSVRLNAYNPGSFTFTNMTSAFTAWKVTNGVTNMLPATVASGAVHQVELIGLPPRQLVPVTLRLYAAEEALPSFFCRFEMVTPEGLRIPFDAQVSVTAPLPMIVVASPASGYVDMSLDRGKMRSTDVELRNDGLKPLLGGRMTAPTVPWIQVSMTKGQDGRYVLPDLAPGQSHTFQVIYTPDENAEMKYYTDTLAITGTNTATIKNLNLYAKVTSELRGALAFRVLNNLGQVVPDASVRVRSALDGTERTGFKTDANGEVEIPNLMEGRWHWQASASGHATQAGTAQIEAGLTTEVETVLTRELVTVTFTVVPVPFTDRYEIKIEQTFSTYVPAPVLVVDPIYQDLGTVSGPFEHTFTATAKNYGLIKLTEFTVQGSQQPNASMIPAISYLPELAPMQQIQIPYTITFLGDGTQEQEPETQSLYTPLALSPEFGAASSRDIRPLSEAPPQFNPCTDDFMEAVQKLMSYLNGRYGSMSGTQLAQAQAALGALWNYASGKGRGGISVGDLLNMYQKLMCLGDLLGSTSKGQRDQGGSSGGGGSGYGGAGGGCFTAGTPVLMADGTLRPIEEVKPGDTVRTGPRKDDIARVAETYTRAADSILELTLADGTTLRTTAEHRIWVDTRGWSLAKDIRPGDRVAATNDTSVQVSAAKATGTPEPVYTFELREDIAFYAHGVLVRHLCGMQFPDMTPTHGTPSRTKGGAQ